MRIWNTLLLVLCPVFARLAAGDAETPTVEDLKKVRWVPQPCVDFFEHLRKARAAEPALATEEEALSLKNDGAAANKKILSGLGRLPISDGEVDWDATWNRFLAGEPTTLNPIFGSSRYEQWMNEIIFPVMPIGPDWKFDHFGDLEYIESWERSEDLLMDKVVFRGDLTWSDGKPLTAYDVEFSWKTLMDKRVRVSAYRQLAEGLRNVKAYDARTVVYFQKEALPTNHMHIAWPIIPRHVIQPCLAADPTLQNCGFNREPVTNGPYKFVSWAPNQEIVVERREEWYQSARGQRIRQKPFFQRIRFRILPDNTTRLLAFRTGQIDEIQLDSDQWAKETTGADFYKKNTKAAGEEWSYAYVGWNAQSKPPNPFFGDKRVRRALALALDHDFLLNDLFSGVHRPGEGIFYPASWMAARDLKPLHRDLDQAERLLQEAGWKDSDKDGILDKAINGKVVPFEFTVACPRGGSGTKVANLMVSSLPKIGVRCRLVEPEQVAFFKDLLDRKYQAFLMAMGTGTDPDTSANLWTTAAIKGGRNYSGFSNERVDELYEKGKRELDRKKRAEIYAEIDRIIYEEHPITVLLYQQTLWGFSKLLRGYNPSPRGFYNFSPGPHSVWRKRTSG